jgi:hypothetical protein
MSNMGVHTMIAAAPDHALTQQTSSSVPISVCAYRGDVAMQTWTVARFNYMQDGNGMSYIYTGMQLTHKLIIHLHQTNVEGLPASTLETKEICKIISISVTALDLCLQVSYSQQ